MKKIIFLFFVVTTLVSAQKKEITLEEIWSGAFRTQGMNELNSMNGDFYSLLNFNENTKSISVDKYSYKTLEKIETVVDSKNLSELRYFETYNFNQNETKLLLGVAIEPIYRHSTLGNYFVYDLNSKSVTIIDDEKIQEPIFSPDSKKIAFVKNNNIYIKNLETKELIQVTTDGKKNKIIN